MSSSDAAAAVTARAPAFQLGETVYSAIAPDERGVVTGIMHRPSHFVYSVIWASDHAAEVNCLEIELSREPLYQQPTR